MIKKSKLEYLLKKLIVNIGMVYENILCLKNVALWN